MDPRWNPRWLFGISSINSMFHFFETEPCMLGSQTKCHFIVDNLPTSWKYKSNEFCSCTKIITMYFHWYRWLQGISGFVTNTPGKIACPKKTRFRTWKSSCSGEPSVNFIGGLNTFTIHSRTIFEALPFRLRFEKITRIPNPAMWRTPFVQCLWMVVAPWRSWLKVPFRRGQQTEQ